MPGPNPYRDALGGEQMHQAAPGLLRAPDLDREALVGGRKPAVCADLQWQHLKNFSSVINPETCLDAAIIALGMLRNSHLC